MQNKSFLLSIVDFLAIVRDGTFAEQDTDQEIATGADKLSRLAIVPTRETTNVAFAVDMGNGVETDATTGTDHIFNVAKDVYGIVRLGANGPVVFAAQPWRYSDSVLNEVANIGAQALPHGGSFLLDTALHNIDSKFDAKSPSYFMAIPVDESDGKMWRTLDITTRAQGIEIVNDGQSGLKIDGNLFVFGNELVQAYLTGETVEIDESRSLFVGRNALLVQAPEDYIGVVNEGTYYLYDRKLNFVDSMPIGKRVPKVEIGSDGKIVIGKIVLLDSSAERVSVTTGIDAGNFFGNKPKLQRVFAPEVMTAK